MFRTDEGNRTSQMTNVTRLLHDKHTVKQKRRTSINDERRISVYEW